MRFKWLLGGVALLIWLAAWLLWRWWRSGKTQDRLTRYLPRARLHWLAPGVAVAAAVALFAIQSHPLMPVYRSILWKVVTGAQ